MRKDPGKKEKIISQDMIKHFLLSVMKKLRHFIRNLMEKKPAADSLIDACNGISEEFQREASCGRLRNHAEQSKEGRADVTGI